jgi:lysophospholipase L1-like esterase
MIQAAKFMAARKVMRGIAASLLGVLVMACSGCGGGGGSDAPSQATKKPSGPVLIESYGDSTTEGYTTGIYGVNPDNQVAVLQRLLQAKYGSTVTVSNQGVGGMESSQLLNGTDGRHPTWAQQMAQSKAQIITIEFGLGDNDNFTRPDPLPDRERSSPQRYAQILTELVTTARAAGKQVVLIESNPSCTVYREQNQGYYAMQVDEVAKQLGVPVVSHYWSIVAMPNWQSLLSEGCVHPSTELYAMEAKLTFDVVSPIVADALK